MEASLEAIRNFWSRVFILGNGWDNLFLQRVLTLANAMSLLVLYPVHVFVTFLPDRKGYTWLWSKSVHRVGAGVAPVMWVKVSFVSFPWACIKRGEARGRSGAGWGWEQFFYLGTPFLAETLHFRDPLGEREVLDFLWAAQCNVGTALEEPRGS